MTTYLIVGLGNPGLQYASDRHNVGFHCVGRLATDLGVAFDKRQKKARVALGTFGEQRTILAKPQTFMNDSGLAVAPLVRFYQVPLEHLLVVFDDLDLPLGTLRLRPEGGSSGHKGMRSIIEHLGTQNFPRLRFGIGRPPGRMDPAAYVLQDFSTDEEPPWEETVARAAAAIQTWLREGIEVAMEQCNRHPGET